MLNVRPDHIISVNLKRVGTSMTFVDSQGNRYDTGDPTWIWMGQNPHNNVGEDYLMISHNTKYRDVKSDWSFDVDLYCLF